MLSTLREQRRCGSLHRSEVVVQPVERLFHPRDERRSMARIEQDMLLVLRRCSESAEKWFLASVERDHEVIPAIEHEHRNCYMRRVIERVCLGEFFVAIAAACRENGSLESALDGEIDGAQHCS